MKQARDALPLSYIGMVPMEGFEPSSFRLTVEVTHFVASALRARRWNRTTSSCL